MKIRLSELRRIIRETVEQEMGSAKPITAADYKLLQQAGFGPVLGRMRGAIEDRVVSGRPVTVDDLQKHIADFDNVTMQDVTTRRPDVASQVAHITGEQVAAYLIDKETTRYNTAPGKPVSPFGSDDPAWDPATGTRRFGTN